MSNNNIPTILVILGATGDLMNKKIVPALFNLNKSGNLPDMFSVVGFANTEFGDKEFREFVADILKKHPGTKASKKEAKNFSEFFSYNRGLFEEQQDYKKIKDILDRTDEEWGVCSNKLFYVAASPKLYEGILNNIAESGLTNPCSPEEGWTRVLVEKPLGENSKSAENLDGILADLFREEQIYRIDHYLAKEMLQNVLSFRFSNNLLEGNWGNHSVEKIEIKLLEILGVEDRGWFYDGMGALRDVGQNHLLQMLAFTLMEHPASISSSAIRRRRAEILKTLITPSAEDIKGHTYRAQYRGYSQIEGTKEGSETETYFKVRAFSSHPKWVGVPFFLQSGKRMGEVSKEVVITFKHPVPCFCPPDAKKHYKNEMRIVLEPDPGIRIKFWSKKPGLKYELEERSLDFSLMPDGDHAQYVAEYEKLLLDAIRGDQTLFLSTEEVREMWRFVDPIIEAWEGGEVALDTYEPDTNEPVENSKAIENSVRFPEDSIEHRLCLVGLGKMGGNMARRLLSRGWEVLGTDVSEEAVKELEAEGLKGFGSTEELVGESSSPRIIWLMVPSVAGDDGKEAPIDKVLFGERGLIHLLDDGDIVIDGGNSFYKESEKRYKKLKEKGINFIDAGVSGGPEGALHGSALMIGGDREVFDKIEILFYELARDRGYQFFEGAGAGHFVKMVHNGIEYGMMQALAEGFDILKHSDYKIDLSRAADVYNNGSVIESRLTGWIAEAFDTYGEDLENVSGSVGHTGMGAWTADAARDIGVKAKIIEGALEFRKESEKDPSYAGKVLSALRNQFGGHSIK